MADFCKQCSTDLFGFDAGDLKNYSDQKIEDGFGWKALCEDCGFIIVNDEGECIANWCKKHGNSGHSESRNG